MIVHGFTAGGSILVTIEGELLCIPDDTSNRHRKLIADWEEAGNSIPEYTPPEPNEEPAMTSIEKLQAFLDANPDVKELLLG